MSTRGVSAVTVGAIVVVGAAAVGFGLVRAFPALRNTHRTDGTCELRARAAVAGRVIALENLDAVPWQDARIVVRGFEHVAGRSAPTGPHETTRPTVDRGLNAIGVDSLQTSTGARWSALTMQPAEVEIVATLRGEPCRAAIDFPAR